MLGSFGKCAIVVIMTSAALAAAPGDLARQIAKLTRSTQWVRQSAIPIQFKTYHPQGLVKIGDRLFMSSVEVIDRDAGKGVAHLFQFDIRGKLIAQLNLGEGAIYHPGGLDYDGRHIWVAVAEYRANSRSVIYRVDPQAMTAREVFRFDDHLGALVHDSDDHSLHGVSWGSRTFYRWPLSAAGRVNAAQVQRAENPSHYVDYQDCKYAGRNRMLCTGVTEMRVTRDAEPFRLGGVELIDLRDHRPLHQAPVLLWTSRGLDMTHNPVWLEATESGLRGYFVPEDDQSTLYIYETQ
jgi:hypothetical protein